MNSVEDRLSKLERSNRWWRFIALLAFGVAWLRVLTGAGEPASFDTITAKQINVVDPKGNIVGALSGQDGLGALELSSSNSKSTVGMAATTQPAIVLADAAGTPVAVLCDNPNGAGTLSLLSSQSKASVAITAATQPVIGLYNDEGNEVAALCTAYNGAGRVFVGSAAGKGRIELSGHVLTRTQPEPSDAAGITLWAENGGQRAFLSVAEEVANLTLYAHELNGAHVALNASNVNQTAVVVKQPGNGGESHLP